MSNLHLSGGSRQRQTQILRWVLGTVNTQLRVAGQLQVRGVQIQMSGVQTQP